MTDITLDTPMPHVPRAPRRRRRVRLTEDEVESYCLEQERERRRELRVDARSCHDSGP
jgi:hypothetical protein